MSHTIWHVLGTLAALLTTFAFIPQVVRIAKVKSVKDVSVVTLLQLALGVSLWVVYGIHLKSFIIVAANAVTFVTLVVALALYYRYK